jgi:2-oxoglutarate dehydrogenase E1 component
MTDGKLLLSADPAWFDAMEAQYRRDPASVPADWRALFEGRPLPVATNGTAAPTASTLPGMLDGRVARLIDAYRARGYLVADYDPLGLADKPDLADLDPAFHGLSEADLEVAVAGLTNGVTGGGGTTLLGLIDHLKASYCGALSADFAHLEDSTRRQWIATRMEDLGARQPAADKRRWILEQLTIAEGFENFLQMNELSARGLKRSSSAPCTGAAPPSWRPLWASRLLP